MCLLEPTVAGLILLTPHVEKTQQLGMKQAEWYQRELDKAPGIKGTVDRLIAKVIGGPVVNYQQLTERLGRTSAAVFRFKSKKISAKWLREMLAIDPATVYSQVLCPILAIGGAKDLQCNPSDVLKIALLAKGRVATHVIENMTHYLRFDYEEPSLHNYKNLLKSRPVEPVVPEIIENWLLQLCL